MVDAKRVKDMAAKKANQFMGQVSGKVPPHKHCRICYEPIPVSAEPRVCKDQTCIDKNVQDEKNQRSVRIWMFVFFGLFALSFILPIFI
jgi:predicted nucleic acid-binding Zn ribbon protein